MKTESILKPPISKFLKSGKVKLSPGEEIGEHVTENREELLIILKGEATLIKEKSNKIHLRKNDTHYIKADIKHNVINETNKDLEYIYVVSLFNK